MLEGLRVTLHRLDTGEFTGRNRPQRALRLCTPVQPCAAEGARAPVRDSTLVNGLQRRLCREVAAGSCGVDNRGVDRRAKRFVMADNCWITGIRR